MRMLMKVSVPVDEGNKAVRDGTLPKTMMGFVEKMKPETVFFTSEGGQRTAFFVFDLSDPTMIPSIAEPFFMNLKAAVTFAPVMNLAEMKAGVEKAMKQG